MSFPPSHPAYRRRQGGGGARGGGVGGNANSRERYFSRLWRLQLDDPAMMQYFGEKVEARRVADALLQQEEGQTEHADEKAPLLGMDRDGVAVSKGSVTAKDGVRLGPLSRSRPAFIANVGRNPALLRTIPNVSSGANPPSPSRFPPGPQPGRWCLLSPSGRQHDQVCCRCRVVWRPVRVFPRGVLGGGCDNTAPGRALRPHHLPSRGC